MYLRSEARETLLASLFGSVYLCWKTEVDYSSFDERASYLLIEFKYKVIYIVRLYFLINIILRYVIYITFFLFKSPLPQLCL